jgi:hypothetical protein
MSVCIAGMHRSGTSMVTKILHDSGFYLGSDSDLVPPDMPGPEEHWENKRFVRINREILARLGGAWDCPPPLPIDWTAGYLDAYRVAAEALLAEFAGREPWAWKDPRNCLTLPFWQAILGAIPTVIVVRNPLEVARSLRRRNGFSIALGLTLWQAYNERLCDAVAKSDRIVTHYDRYFEDPVGELRRILSFLGLATDEETIEKASALQSSELRHHRLTTRDLRDAHAGQALLDLYRNLSEEASWRDTEPSHSDGARDVSLLEDDRSSAQDGPDSRESNDRSDHQPAPRAKDRRCRQRLEEALARIAQLEEMIEVQRLDLAGEPRSGKR